MENEILAFINDLNGFDKQTKQNLKELGIVAGSIVIVKEIEAKDDSYVVEIENKNLDGENIVLGANNVTLFKSYDDNDYRVYKPELVSAQIEK